jgi:hypothetical protein
LHNINTPAKIKVHVGQSINIATNESKARLKCGRPTSAKEKILRKIKEQGNKIGAPEEVLPTKQATKIDPSKLSVQNSPGNKSPEEEPRNILKSYPLKRNKYLKIMRFQ